MRVLITGGAEAIGSHLSDLLLTSGYSIRVLDNLAPQVHGFERHRPPYLADDAELTRKRRPHRARRAEHNARQSTGGMFGECSLV